MRPSQLVLAAAVLGFLSYGCSFSAPATSPSRRQTVLNSGLLGFAGQLAVPRVASGEVERFEDFEQVIAESGLEDWKLADYEAMRDDVPRTAKFEAAIRRQLAGLPSGKAVVVDIGTGPFALLALMAARAGARRVYAIEKRPEAAAQAKEAVLKAGAQDTVVVIEGDAMQVELPERADLIVSELIGSIATQEGVEPIIQDARRRFLKEDVAGMGMIPRRCQTCVAPIAYRGRGMLSRIFAPREGVRSRGRPEPGSASPLRVRAEDESFLEFLAEPQLLEDFDYLGRGSTAQVEQRSMAFDLGPEATSFSGFALWPRVVLDDEDVVEVRGQPDSHWAYVVALMSPRLIRLTTARPASIQLETSVSYDTKPVRYTLRARVPTP